MGFSRQEYWSGWPCPLPGDLPDPGIELVSPVAPALQEDSLSRATGGALIIHRTKYLENIHHATSSPCLYTWNPVVVIVLLAFQLKTDFFTCSMDNDTPFTFDL